MGSAVKRLLFSPFLSVENDGFGEKVIADFFRNAQRCRKQGKMKKFSVEQGDEGFFIVQSEDTTEHPIGRVKSVRKPHGVDPQAILLHGIR